MEQLSNESENAYMAFLSYVNVSGVGLEAAYKYYCKENHIEIIDKVIVPDVWRIWISKYNWDDRLQDLEDGESEFTEEQLAVNQRNRIIDFRNRQIKINQELSKTTRLLLKRIRAAIARLDPNDIPAGAIPNYINSIAKFAELSSKNESDQLALEDLIEALNEVSIKKKVEKPIVKKIEFNFEENYAN